MHIILVLGKTVLPTGEAPEDLRLQVAEAVRFLRDDRRYLLVITGGVTRPGFPSEAETAMQLVPEELRHRVRLETKSLSTRQNILAARELLRGETVDSITAISTEGHKRRTRFLFGKLWPEMRDRFSFRTIGGKIGYRERLFHRLLYLLTIIDPNEKIFLPLKKYVVQ